MGCIGYVRIRHELSLDASVFSTQCLSAQFSLFGNEERWLYCKRNALIWLGERSAADARIICYRPTMKGLDLLPVMIEMIIWADQYEDTAAPAKIMRRLKEDRTAFIAEIRKKFLESK